MKRGLKTALDALCAVVLIWADQFTKWLAVTNLKGKMPVILIPGVLQLQYLENSGMAFGLLQNAQIFFYIITAVMIVLIAWVYFHIPAGEKRYVPLRVITVFLEAGAVGNLIDRVMLHYVRDFIYFSLIDFPIFNVADMYVTVSIFFLVILLLFKYRDDDFEKIFKKQ